MTNIKFIRGDTYGFKFQRKDWNNEVISDIADSMYFTVKKNHNTKDIILQKNLDEGITFDEEFFYHVLINSIDTRELKYGTYVYDIQVMVGNIVTTIAKGDFVLETEVTFDYE